MSDEHAGGAAESAGDREDPLIAELRAHPARGPLGALALDVLSRQAEGRTLFVGREHVKKRAAEHGVVREDAASSLCNVLDLLERGAESDRERALLCSLAVLGLVDAMSRDAEAATALLARTVRHATWLEVATGFSLLRALATETDGAVADRVADELAQRVVDGSVGPHRRAAQDRAAASALLSALDRLARAGSERARAGLAALEAHEGLDPLVRAMARQLVPGGGARRIAPTLTGPHAPPRRPAAWALLAWVSGWALLVWMGRGLAALLGRRATVRLSLRDGTLEIHESGGLLGRGTRESATVVPLTAILSASRETRHGSSASYAAAIAMATGVLVGGYVLFDGLRSGELAIAATGAALALSGVTLDLLVDAVRHARGAPRVTVELVLPRGRVVRLLAGSEELADAFLGDLRDRLR